MLAVLLALLSMAGCGDRSPAGQRADLLAAVPRSALERGLFLWSGPPDGGFGSALPERALDAVLGVQPGDIEAVAESGGVPFTVLLGDLGADEAVETATAAGYEHAEVDGWALLRRAGEPRDALQAAVPAAAVRGRVVVLGPPDEVAGLVAGAPSASEVEWVSAVSRSVEEPLLALGRPLPSLLAAAGGDAGALLQDQDARGDLPEWDGWAAAVAAEGEAEAGQRSGALLLALPEGAADADAAGQLALRAATGPVLGGGRRAADVLEGGAPTYESGTGLVRLPVTWHVPPAALRQDVEASAYTFLVPSG